MWIIILSGLVVSVCIYGIIQAEVQRITTECYADYNKKIEESIQDANLAKTECQYHSK